MKIDPSIPALRERIRELEDDRARGTAALKAAFGDDLWQIGHPAYVVTHMREEYRKVEVLWKQAESRAERLRESGDKVIESKNDRIRELEAENERLLSLCQRWSESCTGRHGSQTQCVESCSPLSDNAVPP